MGVLEFIVVAKITLKRITNKHDDVAFCITSPKSIVYKSYMYSYVYKFFLKET